MWILLLVLACGPKTAPATATSPVQAERAALEQLARDLEDGGEGDWEGRRLGAELATELAVGEADPTIRARALALLVWLRDYEEREPQPVPEITPPEDTGDPFQEEVVDPEGLRADTRATLQVADVRIARAREHLRRGDYGATLDALALLRDGPGWEDALPYWMEAVDLHVAQERERIGQLYVESKGYPREERRVRLMEVRDFLEGLVDDYPESAYAEPLEQNLERVERELEAMSWE
ncbi:MAG: hypothetical protein JRI25_14425 [Deltaproteobacteria bacterium]|nr:hypothetical protein [Deltaproteobacteria bacterium]